ncbi:hypothetical protein EDB89DRAFT_999286 [Lactarius sanguifluus]|nr:hypothetical protein EDB89DRAFT_999286 [Lactarius sanguifluus]
MFGDGLCEFDAVVLVDQPGLHASDLRSLSPESFAAARLQDSPSSSQLPYVCFPHQGNSLQDLAASTFLQHKPPLITYLGTRTLLSLVPARLAASLSASS